jgi:hypothetical protein
MNLILLPGPRVAARLGHLIGAGFLFAAVAAMAQGGSPFTAISSVATGGGGSSTGGIFAVRGTVGQSAVGRMAGGDFSLTGGFWTAVQTPGAPLLRVMGKGPDGVLICWPAPSAGWVLQETTVLASNPQLTKWADVTAPPVVVRGEQNTITLFPAGSGFRYFRLRHP